MTRRGNVLEAFMLLQGSLTGLGCGTLFGGQLNVRSAKIAVNAAARIDEQPDGFLAVVFIASLLAVPGDHRLVQVGGFQILFPCAFGNHLIHLFRKGFNSDFTHNVFSPRGTECTPRLRGVKPQGCVSMARSRQFPTANNYAVDASTEYLFRHPLALRPFAPSQ